MTRQDAVNIFERKTLPAVFSAEVGGLDVLRRDKWHVNLYPSRKRYSKFYWIVWYGSILEIGNDAINAGGECRAKTFASCCSEAVNHLILLSKYRPGKG